MTEGPDGRRPADLAHDWITIWQSELSASATDRERAETWDKFLGAWGHAAAASIAAASVRADGPAGYAAPQPSPRPTPADAAPDDRDAAIAALRHRVDELERRLAHLLGHATG